MMRRDGKKQRKPGEIIRAVLTVLSLISGLALLLYPTVADKINDAVNHSAIGEYERQIQVVDDSQYREMLEAAQAYNDRLFKSEPYIGALTPKEQKEYESLLDIDGTGIMGYIEVPKAKINLAIYHGTSEDVLQTAIGHLDASSLPVPGKSVHTVLSGHSGLPSARLFTDLDQLKVGDTFILHILRETLTYRVEKIERVAPEELKNLRIEEGQEICTLMTCTPYGINTHRLVVTGRRIESPVDSEEETEPASVEQAITSKWNRWFVFLPTLLFLGIVTFVIVRRRRKKIKRKQQ